MHNKKQHESHKGVLLRLKKASGHLIKVISMMEDDEGCLKVAQQLFAVEKAIIQAKKIIIHEHIDHCLEEYDSKLHDPSEFKEITKYL